MTTTLNILHLLMLLAALGCAFFGLREKKGAPLSRRHLIALPLLAVPVALTLLISSRPRIIFRPGFGAPLP